MNSFTDLLEKYFSNHSDESFKYNINGIFYPPAANRNEWTALPVIVKKALLSEAEQYLSIDFKPLPMTLFMRYLRDNNRVDYEAVYFEKRRMINTLVMAECVQYTGRFLDKIIDGIFSICEETAWQLPAHNSYIRDKKSELLPDASTPIIDLFACETAALLSTLLYLIGEKLDSIHPFIRKRILHEINNRIITPYSTKHFWWMGNGDEQMCNWTIWCTQNILLTYFLNYKDTKHFCSKGIILKQACYSIDCFIKEYGDDGCCDEGAQYYHHAGLCLFNTIEILNQVTENAFASIYCEHKIKNIAEYIVNIHACGDYYFNFADCSPLAGYAGSREYLFGKRVRSSELMMFAKEDFQKSLINQQLIFNEINLFYRLQNVFTYVELTSSDPVNTDANTGLCKGANINYKSVGINIYKNQRFSTAVKSGDNNDNHNHNDTGSIIVYKDGRPLLIDVGVGTYTALTFSEHRYELWPMQSAFHNLPTINGVMQFNGSEYHAKNIHSSENFISMDIAPAYPEAAGISSYIRSVEISDEEITLHDIVKYTAVENNNQTVLSLMISERPEIINPVMSESKQQGLNSLSPKVSAQEIIIGNLSKLIVSGASSITFEEIPITDARLAITWKKPIYRLLLTFAKNDLTVIIK